MSTEKKQMFKDLLSKNGYRSTRARDLVFELLLHPEPLAMRDLIVKAEGKIDRVSIYRIIDLFEKLGIANRIYSGWKYKLELSEDFIGHHHHMTCLACGRVVDIEDEAHIDEFIRGVAAKSGFVPHRHTFEIDGYCNQCDAS